MEKLVFVIEKDGTDQPIAGSVDAPNYFFYTAQSDTEQQVIADLQMQIADYIAHEGATMPEWQGRDAYTIPYEIEYDLTSFFEVFGELKINRIAKLAGINETLLRQYASGTKSASANQAAKVQNAVHELGERMMKALLVATFAA